MDIPTVACLGQVDVRMGIYPVHAEAGAGPLACSSRDTGNAADGDAVITPQSKDLGIGGRILG